MNDGSRPHRLPEWAYAIFIVPDAHTRITDAEFQGEMYEVFHTSLLARAGHAVCTPIINICLFALAGLLSLSMPVADGAITLTGTPIAALLALAFHVVIYGRWALIMTPVLALAALLATMLRQELGNQLVAVAVSVMIAATLFQTWSHLGEPLPPPWSRSHCFAPVREVVRQSSPPQLALLVLYTVSLFPLLEFWAALRIWPLQVAHVLGRAGWMKERTRRLQERVRTIQADTRAGWDQPPAEKAT